MSASDVAVLELVRELYTSGCGWRRARAQIQKCLSFGAGEWARPIARILRHESNKVAPRRATGTQRTVHLFACA